jgi:hypothetical protein
MSSCWEVVFDVFNGREVLLRSMENILVLADGSNWNFCWYNEGSL